MKNNIKEIREKKGIKQRELAELTDLSVGYICHLEKGSRKNPSYNTMVSIANALNENVAKVFEL